MPSPPRWLLITAGFAIFAVVAIANSAGYRFGASDQAFYLPAAARVLDPSLFPRDGALLDTQARLTAGDEILAAAFSPRWRSAAPWMVRSGRGPRWQRR
jgi:hypothetical protein